MGTRLPFPRDFLLLKLTPLLSKIAEDDNGQARGACIRSRICWAEEGEASIRFFLHLEKQRGGRDWIDAMRQPDGILLTDIASHT